MPGYCVVSESAEPNQASFWGSCCLQCDDVCFHVFCVGEVVDGR